MFIARHVKGCCLTIQHGQLQSSMEWAVAFGDAAAEMSRSQVRTCTIITAVDENLGYAVMLLRPGAVLSLSIHLLTESLRCPTGNSRNKWLRRMNAVVESSPFETAHGDNVDVLTSKGWRCHLLTLCHCAWGHAWAVSTAESLLDLVESSLSWPTKLLGMGLLLKR